MNGFLNAQGRRGLPRPKANERINDYANRVGYRLVDPQGILERAGCECRCVGDLTGEGEGAYNSMWPEGLFIKCCGGRNCAHVAVRSGQLVVTDKKADSREKRSNARGGRGKAPRVKGKVIARGKGVIRTKRGIALLTDTGDPIPVEQSHPCCNNGNNCNATLTCLGSNESYNITICCNSISYCGGISDFSSICGGAWEIIGTGATPNTQGSTNFGGRDMSNGGFRLR